MGERVRTALVTGGNRGLGREACRQLAARGLRVLLAARTEKDAADAAGALDAKGTVVLPCVLDVARPASSTALAERLTRDGATVDVLVNNAGIALDGFDADIARRTLDVNFFGALAVTDALLPSMPDGASVVMVSSGMGELSCVSNELQKTLLDEALSREALVALMKSFVADVERGTHRKAGWPSSAYRVSKVGLNALTRVLARDLSGRRIRVNAVCPGWVRTDMGGSSASRSVTEGAASIVWAASAAEGPTGGFFRDGHRIDW